MKIKETPTNYVAYYDKMRERTMQRNKEDEENLQKVVDESCKLYREIKDNIGEYDTLLDVKLINYTEFALNTYSSGIFLNDVTKKLAAHSGDAQVASKLIKLRRVATLQEQRYKLEEDIKHCEKLLNLTKYQYKDILKTFYTEVHRQLILNGYGYAFEGSLGWICVNRCRLDVCKRRIDFMKTRKRKEELLEAGEKLYNKEEEDWCKANNIPYNGKDWRVFMDEEYCYEIPLIGCKITNGNKYKFKTLNYRNYSLRNKTNEEIVEYCSNDLEAICNLDIDMRAKLNLCLIADKGLYLNFIRNENQKPTTAGKIDR